MFKRKGVNWGKPLRFILSKEQFDRIEGNPLTAHKTKAAKRPRPIFPPAKFVGKASQNKKTFKIMPNYARASDQHCGCLPDYQLSETDCAFISCHQNRYIFKGTRVLTQDFLKEAIIWLQRQAGKNMNIPTNHTWIALFLQQHHSHILQAEFAELFSAAIYDHWRDRRRESGVPLLRSLWKPTSTQQIDITIPYHPRESERRILRRNSRVVQDQLIDQLLQEFKLAAKLAQSTQRREQLKFRQVCLQLNLFIFQTGPFTSLPYYMEGLKVEDCNDSYNKFKCLASSRGCILKQMANEKAEKQQPDDL